VIQSLRPAIDARRLSVAVALPEEPVIVNVDPTRMAQVLSNILGNAIKYTPAGGNISVRASASDGLASLAIADDGIGMAADLVPRVFDLFVQGDRALDRREGGLGVGLTIAKRLIDLQGGTLTAASDGPGTGSSFTIGLPLAAESTGAELTAAPQASSTLRRVFIVDDNHDAAEALAALIGALGHDVRVADNGHDALSVATTWRPDVMLLDIGLPDMDGYEVARRMREIRALDHVQIVACTGYGGDDDLRRMAEAGFDRHLIKPVGIAELDTLFSA